MKRLLLAAAALAVVIAPTLSAAQPMDGGGRGGRDGRGGWDGRRDGAAPRTEGSRSQAPRSERPRGEGPRGEGRREGGQRDWGQRDGDRRDGGRRGSPGVQTAPPVQAAPFRAAPDARRDRSGRGDRDDRRGDWRSDGDRRWDGQGARGPDRRDARPNDRWDSRGGWNNRDDRRRFSSSGPQWSRTNRDWWRGRSDFRGYNGPRAGFWFAPSYGYYRIQPDWFGRSWRMGDYVPWGVRQYVVVDPFVYGLDWPPPGFQWIYLGNDIVLMDPAGRIVEVLRGVF